MITDWDDAYANSIYIEGGAAFPDRWLADAAAFRVSHPPQTISYGAHPRMVFDLFRPMGTAQGLAVFVHGGYWMALDKDSFSHLAAGALAQGFAVSVPSYVLTPEARIAEITQHIARAVDVAAQMVPGPIYLAGHSAGGHLVSRLGCRDVGLNCAARLSHILSISGVHDMRPLLHTAMRKDLRLDLAEATAESPALNTPRTAMRLTTWVGQNERPEFIRQSELLANVWAGLGADTACVIEPNRHHFDVIDGLCNPHSPMVQSWLGNT